jgi:lipoyl synthase
LRTAKPPWIKARAPGSAEYLKTRDLVQRLQLHTVCQEAHCPNIGECWAQHTATFLIMGEVCTRACRFCAVKKACGALLSAPDGEEPRRVAEAVYELGLRHTVVTSVTRDDLPDHGAAHFAETVKAIKGLAPNCRVELLIPDMGGERNRLDTIMQSGVDVLNHNLETVPRLYPTVRPEADYRRSLLILKWAKEIKPGVLTKSGIMLGLGETREEVLRLMDDLREDSVDIMTIGQYLRPSPAQIPIESYVRPEEFKELETIAAQKGFRFAESSPLTRSSYHAWRHTSAASAGQRGGLSPAVEPLAEKV